MPIKHAALKQIRQDRRRAQRNQARQGSLNTLTKRLLEHLGQNQLDQAATLLRQVARAYDRAAVKGLVHRNTAARAKSRLTRNLNQRRAASSV